MVNRPGRSGGA